MSKWRWIGAIALALVVGAAGTAAYLASKVETAAETAGAYTVQEVPTALKGKAAPKIGLATASGEGSLDLADYKGKVVLLSFWSRF